MFFSLSKKCFLSQNNKSNPKRHINQMMIFQVGSNFAKFGHVPLGNIRAESIFQLNNCLLGFKSHHELMSMEEN